jgi:Putative peptidoglycan binding domain
VRERRTKSGRRAGAGKGAATGALASVGLRLWSTAAHRPVDATAILCAAAATLIVVVNAVFLQSGVHPAPFFANPTAMRQASGSRLASPTTLSSTPPGPTLPSSPSTRTPDRVIDMAPGRAAPAARTQAATSARRNDPIGDLIGTSTAPSSTASVGSSARITAVQRVLSEFGYGQLRLSGAIDEPTSAAIQKFEADHKLPVTGRLSDRLLSELAAMTGRPIQ